MSGTPLRPFAGAFPATPQTINRRSNPVPTSPNTSRKLPSVSLLNKSTNAEASTEPLVPLDVVDAGTQRLLVAATYVALWSWRLYDFSTLFWSQENESLWLFLKWLLIDSAFLFGLPALRVPWLEFSSAVITSIYLGHVFLNACLMFQIGLPVRAWFIFLVKLLYDRETSVSDRRVKPSELLRDDYLLSGKHILHILPEGSAYLNPKRDAFCIGGATSSIELPLQINQTIPISLDFLRKDLDTSETETVSISTSSLKRARKAALSSQKHHDSSQPLMLHFPVKKTGIYTVQKLIDESKLEVRSRQSEVVVVQCPQARVLPTNGNKCRGELSDIAFEVIGAPPLKVKYRRVVNSASVEASFQSIQPEDFLSPLARSQMALATKDELGDAAWARARRVVVPINETLAQSGNWYYAVDQVQDAMGNTVSYEAQHEDFERGKNKVYDSQQIFAVHDRPVVSLRGPRSQPPGCDSQHPLRVALGEKETLPIKFSSDGRAPILDTPHTVEYQFTPESALLSDGEHNPDVSKILVATFKNSEDRLTISESGLYSLNSVSTSYCLGEVEEPAACMLQNPPRPDVDFQMTDIKDKCQEKPVGLRASLDLVGSPPFQIVYTISQDGVRGTKTQTYRSDGLRGQLDLMPPNAGSYTYKFIQISDRYYKGVKIFNEFKQTVKPAASAHFEDRSFQEPLCLNQRASFSVRLGGEGPWNLKWDIIHGGKRLNAKQDGITNDHFTIETAPLESGGDYTISITSVEAGGCVEDLKEEVGFSVRYRKPRAGFGPLEGKRGVHTLEGSTLGLPLRLSGEKPWSITTKDGSGSISKRTLFDENAKLDAPHRGTYEILDVSDRYCPGDVDEEANTFSVDWIERPSVRILNDPSITVEGNKHVKEAICEGDEDSFDLVFTGNAPFELQYEEHAKPDAGAKFMHNRGIHAALGSATIQLETTKAGLYEYKFSKLSDQNYHHNSKSFSAKTLQQRVYPRPTAQFTYPGKTYNFCPAQDTSDEIIPISLTGVPPFEVEIEVKNLGSSRPDIINIPRIPTTSHNIKLPQKYLRDGQSHVSIRSVRDSRGCESRAAISVNSPKVQIAVHDAPAITSLEGYDDYCVGDYVNYRLSGSPPFKIYYSFKGKSRQADSSNYNFRRIIDEPGTFIIEGISDSASECRTSVHDMRKEFHPKPRGSVSKGRDTRKDIHEGGEDELQFDFVGTPPFEFSYIRRAEGSKGQVLETKTERTEETSVFRKVSAEGEYELVSLRDRWCLTAKQRGGGKDGQKLLTEK